MESILKRLYDEAEFFECITQRVRKTREYEEKERPFDRRSEQFYNTLCEISNPLAKEFESLQEEQYLVDDIKTREAFSWGMSIGAAAMLEILHSAYSGTDAGTL